MDIQPSYAEELIDAVIEQIRSDLEVNDTSAIYELLQFVPTNRLAGFLKEEEEIALKQKWNIPVDILDNGAIL